MLNDLHEAMCRIAVSFGFDPFKPYAIEDVAKKAELFAHEYFKHHPESAPPPQPPRMRRDIFDVRKR